MTKLWNPKDYHPDRDWTEDAEHENGMYFNICCQCEGGFIGHKRRRVCKLCHQPPTERKTP